MNTEKRQVRAELNRVMAHVVVLFSDVNAELDSVMEEVLGDIEEELRKREARVLHWVLANLALTVDLLI